MGGVRDALARLFGRPVTGRRDPLGPKAERAAARFLRRRGFRVLERNVRTNHGEADLVCLAPDYETVVIVEVKARRLAAGEAPGSRETHRPEDAITAAKREKLVKIARSIARRRGWTARPLRIDVVAVEWPERGRPTVRLHEGAVAVMRGA